MRNTSTEVRSYASSASIGGYSVRGDAPLPPPTSSHAVHSRYQLFLCYSGAHYVYHIQKATLGAYYLCITLCDGLCVQCSNAARLLRHCLWNDRAKPLNVLCEPIQKSFFVTSSSDSAASSVRRAAYRQDYPVG